MTSSALTVSPLTLFVLALWILESGLDLLLGWLNLRALKPSPPAEFEGVFPAEKYSQSLAYFRANARFARLSELANLGVLLVFFLAGGFGIVESWAAGLGHGPILTGLIFVGALSVLKSLSQLPFAAYHTFRIEAAYGFNRTTPKTFVLDWVKGLVLGAVLGGAILAVILQLFLSLGDSAWWMAWIAVSLFSVALAFLAPAFLLPLFNKFTPIPEGELRAAVEKYAKEQSFTLQGVFVMDGSKRSTKSNAFFTGFGSLRRLVLFDTLMERFALDELMAVVAHEAGHFKRNHIPRSIALQLGVTFALFAFIGWVMGSAELHAAFGLPAEAPHAGLVIAVLLYSPMLRLLSLFPNALSRKHEFEADEFSIRTYRQPEALVSALKKLAGENFAHLTPHPLKVLFDYTHPPMLERIRQIRERAAATR